MNSSTRGASLEAKGRAPGAVGVDGAAPGVPLPSPAGYFKLLAASAGLELIGKNLNFESPAFYASAGLELIGKNLNLKFIYMLASVYSESPLPRWNGLRWFHQV